MPEMSAHRRGEGAGRGTIVNPRPHQYGPHQEDAAPRLVTIWAGQKGREGTKDVPIPNALVEQRRQINTRAHEQACARAEAEAGSGS